MTDANQWLRQVVVPPCFHLTTVDEFWNYVRQSPGGMTDVGTYYAWACNTEVA